MSGSFNLAGCFTGPLSGVFAKRVSATGDGVTIPRVCLFWLAKLMTGTLLAPNRLSSSSWCVPVAVSRFLELDIGISLPTTDGENEDDNSEDLFMFLSLLVTIIWWEQNIYCPWTHPRQSIWVVGINSSIQRYLTHSEKMWNTMWIGIAVWTCNTDSFLCLQANTTNMLRDITCYERAWLMRQCIYGYAHWIMMEHNHDITCLQKENRGRQSLSVVNSVHYNNNKIIIIIYFIYLMLCGSQSTN